jgi:hypothetical protein
MAVSTEQPDEPIEHTKTYHLADGQTALVATADQDAGDATIKAKTLQGVKDKLSSEVSAGVEIEVLSVGGKVAGEHEESREYETEVEWHVRYGLPSFTVTVEGN